jgi:hypothetical protein
VKRVVQTQHAAFEQRDLRVLEVLADPHWLWNGVERRPFSDTCFTQNDAISTALWEYLFAFSRHERGEKTFAYFIATDGCSASVYLKGPGAAVPAPAGNPGDADQPVAGVGAAAADQEMLGVDAAVPAPAENPDNGDEPDAAVAPDPEMLGIADVKDRRRAAEREVDNDGFGYNLPRDRQFAEELCGGLDPGMTQPGTVFFGEVHPRPFPAASQPNVRYKTANVTSKEIWHDSKFTDRQIWNNHLLVRSPA